LKTNLLLRIIEIADNLGIPSVLIGGLALPAYNVARTTLDIDLCIYIKSQEKLDLFIQKLKENNIFTSQNPKINHDLFMVYGLSNELEIWLKPCDAFNWDELMIKKIKHFSGKINVLALEDYILTKLARQDRSQTDLNDIFQIIIANRKTIDWDYLIYRLKLFNLIEEFERIILSFSISTNEEIRKIYDDILKEFKDYKEKRLRKIK